MDPYKSLYETEAAKKRERQARDEAAEQEYQREQAERRAADAERRRKAEAAAAREELSNREDECADLRGDLDDARSATRREKERVTALVNAAREFMRQMGDHFKYHNGEGLNGETLRAWQDLQEVCRAARPQVE